ncbi:MAG: hypothetical protein ABFS12_12290 [Bacteroidota bacterium]
MNDDLVKIRELNNEAIDYFLTDPFYFNQVIEIQDDIRKYNREIYNYKTMAREIGKQILEMDLN